MTNTFCIIGAGSFGLMTALHLRQKHKNANITIFDINKELSSSVNGGNGMLNYVLDIPITEVNKMFTIDLSHKFNNLEFYFIHIINQIFNNSNNRNLIQKIVKNNNKINCNKSSYYSHNFWNKIEDKLIQQNINIKDMTEIIDYKYSNNQIILISKNKEEYLCDKLILCTAGNLNLIKNKYYHKFIEIFSGYSSIVEVKNKPECFYYSNNIFITPYIKNQIKITLESEINSVNNNYYIDKNSSIYNKLSEQIKNNPEIQKLGFVSIKNIWRGSRAMTYDIIPFIEQIDRNVYLMTGGGYMGTHMAYNFSKWLVELIDKIPFSDLPIFNNKIFNPRLERLELIRKKYYVTTYFLIILIIIIIFCYKL